MFYDNENFEVSSDLVIDNLLTDLPFDLMKENIRDQINDPLSTNINYVNTITEKCDVVKYQYQDINMEVIININSALRSFFDFVINEIDNKFGLDIDTSEESDNFVISVGEALYNFMILRYKKNISKYIYTYITRNKKILVERMDKVPKKKDVTSISLRKQVKNKDDVIILSNLPSIIKHIINLDIDALDFMEYVTDDECYEGSIIKQLITNGIMTGNFVTAYFNLLVNEYDDVMDEIQTDIKLKFIKKGL